MKKFFGVEVSGAKLELRYEFGLPSGGLGTRFDLFCDKDR
jgi:hypothetical protein